MAKDATDATLTKLQRNAVLKWVVEEEGGPEEFDWSEIEELETTQYSNNTYRVSVLTHNATGFYVVFGQHYLTISPGPTRKVEEVNLYQNWGARERTVRTWSQRVKAEHEAPDLWAMALQDRNFLQLTSVLESANTSFTPEERRYIASRLEEIRGFVIGPGDLDADQRQLVEAQIEYAKEATKRLGRLDWKGVLVNTLITIAVTAAFAPDRTNQLFHMAADFFMPLYQSVRGMIP
jgi:hypothetical protein